MHSIEDIKSHPFFDGVDWKNLMATTPPNVPKKYNSNRSSESPIDMAHFLDKIHSEESYASPSKKLPKGFQIGSQIEFLRYDLLHNMNKKAALAIKYFHLTPGLVWIRCETSDRG